MERENQQPDAVFSVQPTLGCAYVDVTVLTETVLTSW